MTTANGRTADHPIDLQFLQRWSPRAYDAAPIPREDLLTVLEAARWAPSALAATATATATATAAHTTTLTRFFAAATNDRCIVFVDRYFLSTAEVSKISIV